MKTKELSVIAFFQYGAMGINFGTQVLLTVILPLSCFGAFAKIYAIREVLIAFLSLSIGMSVINVLHKNKKQIVTTTLLLSIFQALIILLLGVILFPLITYFKILNVEDMFPYLLLMFSSALMGVYTIMFSIFDRNEDFMKNSLITFIVTLLSSLSAVLFSMYDQSINSLIFKEMLSSIGLFLGYLLFIFKRGGVNVFALKYFNLKLALKMLAYSIKIYLARLAEIVLNKMDILLISYILPATSVGIYDRAKYFATIPQMLVTNILVRINFVKFSKDAGYYYLVKTNKLAFVYNVFLYVAVFISLYIVNRLFVLHWDVFLSLYFWFWAYIGFGSVVENIKTFLYAKAEIFYAMLLFRLLPLVLFFIYIWNGLHMNNILFDLRFIAFFSSLFIFIPILFSGKIRNVS